MDGAPAGPSCAAHAEHTSEIGLNWCKTLYDTKAAKLVLFGRSLGLTHTEAEDVLQDTFIALMQLERAPTDPVSYSVRAYRNRALNYRRGLWRRLKRDFESRRWFESSDGQDGMDDSEEAALQCLRDLPVEQREVIVLKIWHRHTFEEIGRILDLSPNTVAGRFRYGIRKIRSRMSEADMEKNDERLGRVGTAIPGIPT